MITVRPAIFAFSVTVLLAACEGESVNPPTEPAQPVSAEDGSVPASATGPGGANPDMPGSGPATFVGTWAAEAGWCANTTGDRRPITITPMRFEGYENSCAITSLDQVVEGYEATLACQSEGATARERIRLSAQGETLRLTWLNRDNAVVLLHRCPAPTTVPAKPAGG
jgi:hypothetical protein